MNKSEQILSRWQQARDQALREESFNQTEIINGSISVGEMISFGEKLRQVTGEAEKYSLLTQKAPDGNYWYNIILGEGNIQFFQPIIDLLAFQSVEEGVRWQHALDVGTGSGNNLLQLSQFCNRVSAVDLSQDMLRIARGTNTNSETSFYRANAGELPFKNETFDLVISNGLTVYLSGQDTIKFAQEISRVLVPGGIYLETIQLRENDDQPSNLRDLLIDLLGLMALNHDNHNSPRLSEQINIFIASGLSFTPIRVPESRFVILKFTKSDRSSTDKL